MDLHPGPEKSRVSTVKLLELEPVQQALHDNKDWYQDLVEHGQDLLCIHDLQGRLLLVNPAPARVLGYSVEEMLKIPMREMIIPEFRPDFDAYLKDIAITGESHGWMGVMTRSGERRIWEYRNTLRTDGVSSPIVRGMAHDVTEQRRAEEMAREANELLRSKASENERTIRELNLFRTVVDLETLRFMDANEKACSTLGYTREELLSLRVLDIDPGVTESSIETIREQWRKMGWLMLETVHRRKDGSTFPVEVSTRQVHVDRDYVVAIVRDITERKQAEERLREYERVVEGLEEIIMVVDRDYRYVIANRAFLNSRGLEREQVIGHIVDEVVNREVFETVVKEKMDECFGGKVVQYELRYRFPKLGERDLQVSYFPIEGPKGVDRIAAILRDITERKQADGALQRSEERYRNFISQSSEGIFRMDAHIPIDIPEAELIHRILYEHYMVECNDAMAAMYGLTSGEQMRGKRFKEIG